MHARYEIFLEAYNKTINVEGQLMVLMANRYILPAAFQYQTQVGQSVAAVKAGGRQVGAGEEVAPRTTPSSWTSSSCRPIFLAGLLTHGGASADKHAKYMRDKVIPAMVKLRETGDLIEVSTPARNLADADVP
jgi:glutamine synthetase